MLIVAPAVALAGCGDDEPEPAETATETTTVTATEEPRTADPEGSGGTTDDGQPPPAAREVDELTVFSSPSGNIVCAIEPLRARCDIGERDWEPPKRPRSCELDYGHGLELTTGGVADLVCASDSTHGATEREPLPYGEAIAAGLLRCESEQTGITCIDTETGRGFMISRESYEIF